MNKIICVVLALAIFLPAPILRSEMKLEDVLAKMDETEQKVKGVQFEFEQKIIYSLTGEEQTNSGQVTFQKPNNIHVKQNNPLEQIIVSNGKKVWIYTPQYKQVVVDTWKKWASSSIVPPSMLNFGQNWTELKKTYTFEYHGQEGTRHVLILTPKKKEAWKLKFWVDDHTFVPVKAQVMGENIVVDTETKNYKINPQLDTKMFNFQPPRGVEVLTLP